MNRTYTTTTGALLLALAVSGLPASAASMDQGARDRRPERAVRVQSSAGASRDRGQATADRGGGRQAGNAGARAGESRRETAVPRQTVPRADTGSRGADRQTAGRQPDTRQSASRPPVSRQYNAPAYNSRPYDNRAYTSRAYDNRAHAGRTYGYGGYTSRPYISRPRIRIGLGISIVAGRPFAFRFDYRWSAPYARRFMLRSGIGYGGMSFLINPDDAAIYVDGEFIGIAREFRGQPIPLAPGRHEIALDAADYEPVVFDVTIRPGQVVPYRGSLMPYR